MQECECFLHIFFFKRQTKFVFSVPSEKRNQGGALLKLKSKCGSNKLPDGKTIWGYGKLTADRIDKLQTYYGLSIR